MRRIGWPRLIIGTYHRHTWHRLPIHLVHPNRSKGYVKGILNIALHHVIDKLWLGDRLAFYLTKSTTYKNQQLWQHYLGDHLAR